MGDPIASVGDQLADRLVEVDPLLASDWGVASCDLPELSPSWLEERRAVFASAIANVTSSDVLESERVAAALIAERGEAEVAWFDSGEAFSELQAALDSPLFRVRHCFDEMPTDSDDDWERIATRL